MFINIKSELENNNNICWIEFAITPTFVGNEEEWNGRFSNSFGFYNYSNGFCNFYGCFKRGDEGTVGETERLQIKIPLKPLSIFKDLSNKKDFEHTNLLGLGIGFVEPPSSNIPITCFINLSKNVLSFINGSTNNIFDFNDLYSSLLYSFNISYPSNGELL